MAVSVTTVTSGQHYFIDVPAGVAVALAGCSSVAGWCRLAATLVAEIGRCARLPGPIFRREIQGMVQTLRPSGNTFLKSSCPPY